MQINKLFVEDILNCLQPSLDFIYGQVEDDDDDVEKTLNKCRNVFFVVKPKMMHGRNEIIEMNIYINININRYIIFIYIYKYYIYLYIYINIIYIINILYLYLIFIIIIYLCGTVCKASDEPFMH